MEEMQGFEAQEQRELRDQRNRHDDSPDKDVQDSSTNMDHTRAGGAQDSDNDESDVEDYHHKTGGRPKVYFDPSIQFHKITPALAPEKVVYKFFRSLIKQWELDLNMRGDAEKSTAKGKLETKSQKLCKDHIRPLFKLCKRKQVRESFTEVP